MDKWLLENDLQYNFSSTYRANYKQFWEQELKEFGGNLAFQRLWTRYRNLKHQFHVIDIVQDSDKLFDIIDNVHGTKVLWTTNIWSSEMLQWNIEPEQLEKHYTKFKSRIKNLVVYGHDYCGIDLNDSVKGNYTHVRFA